MKLYHTTKNISNDLLGGMYMNQHRKIITLVCTFLMTLHIAACGQTTGVEFTAIQQKSDIQTLENTDLEINGDETVNTTESSVNQPESDVPTVENTALEAKEDETINAADTSIIQQGNSVQTVENVDSEMTTEELLDLFVNGSINAVRSTDSTSAYYITDLNMNSGEWDSCSIGERVDLDNDGEDELIINGPYGGIYLDARNNKVYEFAIGDGNAIALSYVYYNGAVWIMYSNDTYVGYKCYHMEKFEGADNLAAEINFSEELIDPNNAESGMKYTLNGNEISYEEYTELCSKIFATEVNTN